MTRSDSPLAEQTATPPTVISRLPACQCACHPDTRETWNQYGIAALPAVVTDVVGADVPFISAGDVQNLAVRFPFGRPLGCAIKSIFPLWFLPRTELFGRRSLRANQQLF